MTHPTIASKTYLGMALTQTLKQMNLSHEQQRLMTCLSKAYELNLPEISLDSVKNKLIIKCQQIETTEAPQSKQSNRFQYFRGLLHKVQFEDKNYKGSNLLNEGKKFAVIELVGDNSNRFGKQRALFVGDTEENRKEEKRAKTLEPKKGRKLRKQN